MQSHPCQLLHRADREPHAEQVRDYKVPFLSEVKEAAAGIDPFPQPGLSLSFRICKGNGGGGGHSEKTPHSNWLQSFLPVVARRPETDCGEAGRPGEADAPGSSRPEEPWLGSPDHREGQC